jgi:hypothetical protein
MPERFSRFTERVAAIDDRHDLARFDQLFDKGQILLVRLRR